MSFESYIRLYQELLTMIDSENEMSIGYALCILREILTLAEYSDKADPWTLRAMHAGVNEFDALARHRDDFAGRPGDFPGNEAKRRRLLQMLGSHC